MLVRNLTTGGFTGDVMLVNPKHASVDGRVCFPDVASLPETPDLAVIAVPAASVPEVVRQLTRRGTAGAVVISAGFAERGPEGQALQAELLAATATGELRVVGPNCLGILVPRIGLNASFAHLHPAEGGIAFVTQSGAVVTAVLDWAQPRGIGFSHLVSLGGMGDVDFGDMMDYLANDARTDAILLYIEAIKEPRKFMSASRAAARMKPVLAVKAGRHAASAKAAMSHTGALAGSDAVYGAAFRRAGILRVLTLEELFDAVETLSITRGPRPTPERRQGNRLAIVTNGGGLGVLAADALVELGGELAELAPETVTELSASLPDTWSHANPVDIVGDAPGERYAVALRSLAKDGGVDGVLVINCPTAVVSRTEAAQAVIGATGEQAKVPLLTSFVGAETAAEPRKMLTAAGVPTYDTPEDAVRGFMHFVRYAQSQRLLMETPPSMPELIEPDTARAREILARATSEGREWLTAPETKEVMAAYGLLTPPGRAARDPAEAAEVAATLGGSVALKVLSPDITHKSDVGGVVLGLEGPQLVKRAAERMIDTLHDAQPDARIDGFLVESMVRRPDAIELIMGAFEDASFGPVVVFGQGGTAAEIIGDRALGLPPLNMQLAHEMMRRTKVHRLLTGYRNVPAVNLDAVALSLVKVAQMVADLAEITEMDINPLLADSYGVISLDARIRLAPYEGSPQRRLAIRPYPVELEEEVGLADGRRLLLRPIRPEDEPSLQKAFSRLTPEEIRLRFFLPWKTFSHMVTARFTQIDYDRDMVLILTDPGPAGTTQIHAIVQINTRPRSGDAEFAILVEAAMTGLGLGPFLLHRIVDYARSRGIPEIHGNVLSDNTTMLKLCHVLGFTSARDPRDPSVIRVSRRLDDAPADGA